MNKLLKPKRLTKGDVIGIITPASPIISTEKLNKATSYIESLGYRVKFGKHIYKTYGYLAGTDDERIDDIHEMFTDKSVKAIFAIRGGYGTPRILNSLDYKKIGQNPKILVGFSDITALSCAIFAKTGLISFSGPMLLSDMEEPDEFSQEHFWQMVTSTAKKTTIENYTPIESLKTGTGIGRLKGGNLSLLSTLIGTPYLPSLKNAILFCEDIGEKPYRIDRMFSQFLNTGVFKNLNGFIAGQFTGCGPDIDKPSLSLETIFSYYVKYLSPGVPAVKNLTYGHTIKKLTLPIGVAARLTVTKRNQSLELIESALVK